MPLTRRETAAGLAGLLGAAALGRGARAQSNYPDRTIHLIVPYAAGGSVDPMARLMADRLAKDLGASIVVENRPGAGGNIGIESVITGPHDGYTLLATPAAVAINPTLYSKVPYDLERDLVPIGMMAINPMVVMATPSLGVKNIAEFVNKVREKPNALNYGISGNGTLDHLVCERLKSEAKLEMQRVNYGGVPKAMTALVTGEVQMFTASAAPALPFVRDGKAIPLAVTSAKRSSAYPDVPTMIEQGFPGFAMAGWTSFFVPRDTPPEIARKLHAGMAKVVAQPEVAKVVTEGGGEVPNMSMDEMKAFLRDAARQFGDVVRASGARVE